MTNAIITIQNATSNGLIEQYSSFASWWSNFADFSAGVVTIGVVGEAIELTPKIIKAVQNWRVFIKQRARFESLLKWFEKHEHALDIWGGVFWALIVLGLAGELLGSISARHFDSLTIGQLTEKSSVAIRDAADSNMRSKQLESTNLLLQIKLSQLDAKSRWRSITPEQKMAFIESTKALTKMPVRIRMEATANAEVKSFGEQIRALLDAAGFVETNKDQAIGQWPPEVNILWNGEGPEMPPILLLHNFPPNIPRELIKNFQNQFMTNPSIYTNPFLAPEFAVENSEGNPEVYFTNNKGVPTVHATFKYPAAFRLDSFKKLESAFNDIGIKSEWGIATNIPTGMFEIFINPR